MRRGLAALAFALLALGCGGSSSDSAPDGRIFTTQIAANGFVFDARVAGPERGPLVLLLHGFPQSSYEWRAQLAALGAAGFRAVAPDMRGYSPGARPEEVPAYQLQHLASDVVAIADSLGAERFHLVGHDWGASVAWQVAIVHPERVRSLGAVSVPHPAAFADALANDPDQQRRSGYIAFFQMTGTAERALLADDARLLRDIYGDGPAAEAADEYIRLLTEPGALTAALNYYRNFAEGFIARDPVRVPTLYVWSSADVALGRYGAEATAGYVEGPYRFVVIDGVSHWVPEDAADALSTLLLEHLRQWS